jgi:hypothetical protein
VGARLSLRTLITSGVLHEVEGNKSFAGRRSSKSRVIADVVFSCLVVTDEIHSDTLRNAAGKNLDLTFFKRAGSAGSLRLG